MSDRRASDDPIERARRLDSTTAARELYDRWAEQYDADVFETQGITGSRRIAELTAQYVTDRDAPVVDLGCGTGVVGRHLADAGFTSIVGLDLSPGMLAIAERTGAYEHLIEADLNDPPALHRRFGVTVSAGTFTTGHVGADAVSALLEMLRKPSWLVWAVAPTMWPSFETALADADVSIVNSAAEPIRPDSGDDESHMVVGRTASAPR